MRGTVHRRPRIRPDALPAAAWPGLFGLDRTGAVGSLVWRAVADRDRPTVAAAREYVADADAARAARRGADAQLALAERWDVFDPDGLTAADLADGDATVLDCSALPPAAATAVCAAVARALYDARVRGTIRRLPWLFVDEAHAFFGGVAGDALATLLTRGRAPGVSLVCATQRPAALPDVAVSQADLLVAHRLHGRADLDALRGPDPVRSATTSPRDSPTPWARRSSSTTRRGRRRPSASANGGRPTAGRAPARRTRRGSRSRPGRTEGAVDVGLTLGVANGGHGRDSPVSADGRSVGERLVAGAVEKPVLGLFVVLLLVMATGFLVGLVLVVT